MGGRRDPLEWDEVSCEHVITDEWIDFRRSSYRFPDGTVYEPFYTYSRKDFVVVAATDEEGRYICVRQFRQGIGKVTTEFPAGGIEKKDGSDILEAAKRELLEETGYVSDDWRHILTIPENATLADNYAYIFVAESCRRVSDQSLDDTEFLNVVLHTPEEIKCLIDGGDFMQAIHALAFYLSGK
ncbi:MAG: NUDIX hydrolase [Lachnospiraceae bacterium]|nr:NUDIX hydrolase [Lachnospiraceae bacterium]